MNEKALFTKFWTDESATTSKVLSRIPEGSTYRPDPKSRTAHEIAWQIVGEEKMLIEALENGTAVWNPGPLPATMKEVVDAYETQRAAMRDRWNRLPDAKWAGNLQWFGGERPAAPMAWSFLFDIVHHRGRSRPICVRWGRRCRRSTARAATSRSAWPVGRTLA